MKNENKKTNIFVEIICSIVGALIAFPLVDWVFSKINHEAFTYTVDEHIIHPIVFGFVLAVIELLIRFIKKKKSKNKKEKNDATKSDTEYRIHLEKITSKYENLGVIKEIYEEAFPANEKKNFNSIVEEADNGVFELLAIVDGNDPVGMTCWCPIDEKYIYHMYIAIRNDCRGMKYGSETIDYLRNNNFKDNVAVGLVEALIAESENYEQRKKRMQFYIDNEYQIYDEIIDLGTYGKYQAVSMQQGYPYSEVKEKMQEFSKFAGYSKP